MGHGPPHQRGSGVGRVTASSKPGSGPRNSSKKILASSRARLAPMHTCSPKPKARWVGKGRPGDDEPVGRGAEDLLVTVGRGVQQDHELAGRDGVSGDLDVDRGGPAERLDRGDPPEDLLDRRRGRGTGRRPAGPVGRDDGPGPRPHREINVRVVSLPATRRVRQNPMISAWLSGRPSSDDVLSRSRRSLDSVAGESMCPIRKAAISPELVGPLALGDVGALDDRVGPPPEEGAVGVGDTEHLGDHRDGDRRGHRVHEVDASVGGHRLEDPDHHLDGCGPRGGPPPVG